MGNQNEFNGSLSEKLKKVFETFNTLNHQKNTNQKDSANKAFVYPLMQLNDCAIRNDEQVTKKLFDIVPESSNVILAAGYFNLTKDYSKSIIETSKANYKIIFSSPEANGFFEAKGVSRFIPIIYSNIEEEFFRRIKKVKQDSRISLHEYNRDKWSN